jgi:hypothetical protein
MDAKILSTGKWDENHKTYVDKAITSILRDNKNIISVNELEVAEKHEVKLTILWYTG